MQKQKLQSKKKEKQGRRVEENKGKDRLRGPSRDLFPILFFLQSTRSLLESGVGWGGMKFSRKEGREERESEGERDFPVVSSCSAVLHELCLYTFSSRAINL